MKLRARAGGRARRAAAVTLLGATLAACGGEPGAGPESGATLASTNGAASGPAPPAGSPASSAAGNYLAALHASRTRQLGRAAGYMAHALERDPASTRLLRRSFILHAAVGDMDEARRLAAQVRQRGVGQGVAVLFSAVDAAADGEMALAREHVRAMPERGVAALMRPLLLGWLDVADGRVDNAVARLEGLNGGHGLAALRRLHTALMHDVAGNTEQAAKAYDAAGADVDRLTSRLVWQIGNFYARQGETERAREVYRALLARNADDGVAHTLLKRLGEDRPSAVVGAPVRGMAEAMFNVAGLLNREGANDLALVVTQLSLRLRPDGAAGRLLLGEIMQDQNRHAAALESYRDVPGDSPLSLVARVHESDALAALGRREEALATLKKLAEARPDSYVPLYRAANLLREDEHFERAAELYAQAEQRLTGEPSRRHWTLFYFHGIALERTDRWSDAATRFETALDLYPDQPYVMNYLAYSWVEQDKNLDRALTMLNKAVEQRPEDGFIVDSLGWVHYKLGNYDKAVKHLERAVELRPEDPTINNHLGDAYWHVNRKREARYQWERALDLGPRDDEAEAIRSKLDDGLSAAERDAGAATSNG